MGVSINTDLFELKFIKTGRLGLELGPVTLACPEKEKFISHSPKEGTMLACYGLGEQY